MIPNEGIPISTTTGVPGWRHGPDEEQVIITYAQRYVPDNGLVVELGTEYGRGASELAYGCSGKSGVRLVSVDLFPSNHGVVGDLYAAWEHNLRQAEHLFPDVHIGFLKGDTAEVGFSTQHAKQQGTLAEGWKDGISLLFIDGGHDTKYVTRDLEAWSPLMTASGVILIHDYWKSIDSHPLHMEVKKAVDAWHNADLWQRLDLPGSLVAFHRLDDPQHLEDELKARLDEDAKYIEDYGMTKQEYLDAPNSVIRSNVARIKRQKAAAEERTINEHLHEQDKMPNFPAVFDDDENPTSPVNIEGVLDQVKDAYTIREIADMRGVSVSAVRNWVRDVEPVGKDGRADVYRLEDLPS